MVEVSDIEHGYAIFLAQQDGINVRSGLPVMKYIPALNAGTMDWNPSPTTLACMEELSKATVMIRWSDGSCTTQCNWCSKTIWSSAGWTLPHAKACPLPALTKAVVKEVGWVK